MARKVTHAVVSYVDADGNWQTALRGTEVDVHKDDLGRLEAAGAFDVRKPDEAEESEDDSDKPASSKPKK